jgi:hypothetical protein
MSRLPATADTAADPQLYCRWHHGWIPHDQAVYMGASPTISGPGTVRYACTPCIVALDLPIPPNPGYTNQATGGAS